MLCACTSESDQNVEHLIGGKDKIVAKLTMPEYLSIAFDGNNELSNKEAEDILNEFIAKDAKTRSDLDVSFNIEKEYYFDLSLNSTSTRSNIENEKAKFVEFSIKSKTRGDNNQIEDGFAIVSADNRFPNVLVFVEKGSRCNAVESGADLMIARAENVAIQHISKIEEYKSLLRESTIEKVSQIHQIDDYSFDKVENGIYIENSSYKPEFEEILQTRGSAVPNPPGVAIATIGPLIEVEWIQGGPQNMFINECTEEDLQYWPESIYGGRYPAGCTAVAVATAMSYFKPSMYSQDLQRNINWSTALSTKKIDWFTYENQDYVKESAAILHHVAAGINTTYGPKGGTASVESAKSYLSNLGILIDSRSTCNYQTIRPSIGNYRPVIITGTCRALSRSEYTNGSHAWVMDGIKIMRRPVKAELQQYNNYGNCNFGWVFGQYNGWYLFDSAGTINFDCGSDKYDINLASYPNIRRR